MSQEVKSIKLADLVLWTENPRDPIDVNAQDQDIVDRALADTSQKWNLAKLAKEMGPHYDFSELPTVVYERKTPIVYDGNRRIVLGKMKHGLVTVDGFDAAEIPAFPSELPCNVCSKAVALQNVYRKHAETGSWLPLERDIFLHKHMKKQKSAFLVIEEKTGLISSHPHLNQRFVKEEVFREDNLERLGISLRDDKFLSKHSPAETRAILNDIARKVKDKELSTRHNRGQVIEVLDPDNQRIIAEHAENRAREVSLRSRQTANEEIGLKRSRRVQAKAHEFFGGALYLRAGQVSNLYRDVYDLHSFYLANKKTLSGSFPSLLRMALRLLTETAAKECSQPIDRYLKARFADAKSTLDQNVKTTLANHNVNETSIVQLLHTGAHNYTTAASLDQTVAVSIIVGAILMQSHGKPVTK
jgi:hypothetical protein